MKLLKIPKRNLDLFVAVLPAFGQVHAPVRRGKNFAFDTPVFWNELDEKGVVTAADVITPTAQKLNNTEDQWRGAALNGLQSRITDETLQQRLAIIARAYDPCISCSVHVIRND